MLSDAMGMLVNRLNQHYSNIFDPDEEIGQLGAPVSPDGVMPVEASNKVLLFLTNINKETLPSQTTNQGFNSESRRPALYLNITVGLAANFRQNRYADGLNYLSQAILCFHKTPIIDSTVVSNMPTGISKLIVDIENTSLGEESNLWGILGGKYLPSILYKVRMLSIADDSIVSHGSAVRAPERAVRS